MRHRIYNFVGKLAHDAILAFDPNQIGCNVTVRERKRPKIGIITWIAGIKHIKRIGGIQVIARRI